MKQASKNGLVPQVIVLIEALVFGLLLEVEVLLVPLEVILKQALAKVPLDAALGHVGLLLHKLRLLLRVVKHWHIALVEVSLAEAALDQVGDVVLARGELDVAFEANDVSKEAFLAVLLNGLHLGASVSPGRDDGEMGLQLLLQELELGLQLREIINLNDTQHVVS